MTAEIFDQLYNSAERVVREDCPAPSTLNIFLAPYKQIEYLECSPEERADKDRVQDLVESLWR